MHDTLTIEQRQFDEFMNAYRKGAFGSQRLGQAFYNHFNLQRLADQQALHNIHAKDGQHALASIRSIFVFN